MPGRRSARRSAGRWRIAELAARIMSEEAVLDHDSARRKAIERLGLRGTRDLPDNGEIAERLAAYQRLFDAEPGRMLRLRRLGEAALGAMRLVADFDPLLAGPALDGTALDHSRICLHVFADTAEDVGWLLMEKAVPFELGEKRLRRTQRERVAYPCYRFIAHETVVELVVLSPMDRRHAPLSPIDGRPMARADRATVEGLVREGAGRRAPYV